MLELPILAGIGLGGISLGDSVDDVIARHGEPCERRGGGDEPFDSLNYGEVMVYFTERRAAMISAEMGYLGQTLQGAYPGMPWLEFLSVHPDVYYDATWAWMVPGIDGLEFIIARDDDHPAMPEEGVEEQVVVTDPENAFVLAISVRARGERAGPWERIHGKLAK